MIQSTGSPRMSHNSNGASPAGLRRPAANSLLKNLNKDQVCFIGNSMFGLDLVNTSAITKDTLIADIAAAMENSPGCGCNGESNPCHPDVHRFSPELFGAGQVQVQGPGIQGILDVNQSDLPVSQPESQFVRQDLPPVSLNPVQSVFDQRQSLLTGLGAAGSPARLTQQQQREDLRARYGVGVASPPSASAAASSAPGLGGTLGLPGLGTTGDLPSLHLPANYGPPLMPRGSAAPLSAGGGGGSVNSSSATGSLPHAMPAPSLHQSHYPTHSYSNTLPNQGGFWPGQPAYRPPAPAAPGVGHSPYGNAAYLPQPPAPPPRSSAPPPPPPGGDAVSSLAWMMHQMEINRAEERQLREREMAAQQASQQAILFALAGRSETPGAQSQVPPAILDIINPTRGKFGVANRVNPEADREIGATLPNQYGLFGDLSNVDVSSIKNKIKSGENGDDDNDILFKEIWVNQFLNRQMLGNVKHCELDIGKFALGFVTKIYCDMPHSVRGTPYFNMTKILMLLLRLAVTGVAWQDVLDIDRSLFKALERRQVSWESWSDLEIWWKQALDTLEFKKLGGATAAPAPAKRAGSELGGAPPAKVQKGATCGIPNSWLKEQNLCIKFNVGRCSTNAPHPSPTDETVSLRHLCAGCLRLQKGSDSGHGANKCPNKPRGGFFA